MPARRSRSRRSAARAPWPWSGRGERVGGAATVIAALELQRRAARAAHAAAYLAVSVPIALLGLLAIVLLTVGALVSLLGIGLPVLLAGAGACRGVVRLDRRVANRFLGARIPPLPLGRTP